MSEVNERKWFSQYAAAKYVGASASSMERLPIPYVEVGKDEKGRTRRFIRYDRKDLDNFLESHKKTPSIA